MADELRNFGSTLDLFETALEDFDGAAYGDPLISIADGINVLTQALSNFNFVDSKIRCYENVNAASHDNRHHVCPSGGGTNINANAVPQLQHLTQLRL